MVIVRNLRSKAIAAGVAAAAGLLLAPASAGAQEIDVTGDASGLTVAVDVLGLPVNVGPLPVAQTPPGESQQVLGVSAPANLANADVLAASSQPTGDGVTSAAQVVGADAVAGAVAADVITATCTSNAGGSTGNSSLANADVLGIPVAISPPPNTQVPLPLIGSVFLNEQSASNSAGSTSMTVNAVRVALAGALGNGDIVISHAGCAATGTDVLPGVGIADGPGGPGGGGGGGGPAGPATAVTGNPTFTG
jgi:hypothetical protein